MKEDLVIYIMIFVLIIVIGGIIFTVAYMIPDGIARMKSYESSCEKIGMEFYQKSGFDFCIDDKGNANYVKIDCENIAWKEYECIPTIITIGYLRIISQSCNRNGR